MALLSLSVGVMTQQYFKAVRALDVRDELRLIAEAGVKKAMAVLNSKERKMLGADSYKSRWSSSESDFKNIPLGKGVYAVGYEIPVSDEFKRDPAQAAPDRMRYGVVDEESKIHLNRMNSSAILTKLFELAADLNHEQAYGIACSILDWRDEDNNPYDAGAESKYYEMIHPAYSSKNAPFGSLEELMLVKGMTPQIFDQVAPYLTISGSGQVNINTASLLVLRAIGFSESLVEKIKAFRKGRDYKSGTGDDSFFTTIETAVAELDSFRGLTDIEKATFGSYIQAGYLSTQSSTFLVCSSAYFKGRSERMSITCVFERFGNVVAWREKYTAGQRSV
jgi:hypothetical protein